MPYQDRARGSLRQHKAVPRDTGVTAEHHEQQRAVRFHTVAARVSVKEMTVMDASGDYPWWWMARDNSDG
ncbi:hypothetical protein E2C01_093226 [Portunus trituberculatus]|uniref:Uncharacterized protein n=1 Tax=Portunus trituberculatus TaxID=210409 RepID=A0A5B7JY16_PORTR|nr:hypothetical protein [Portunus trituberculatus]